MLNAGDTAKESTTEKIILFSLIISMNKAPLGSISSTPPNGTLSMPESLGELPKILKSQ